MADRRIPIPRLPNPGAMRWLAGTCVAVLAVTGYTVLTEPVNLAWVGLALALVFSPVLLVVTRRLWVDPVAGTVGYTLLGFWRLQVTLSPELPVAMVDSGTGCLQLSLARFPRRIFVPLLALTVYDQSTQRPEILRLLAEQLDRRVPDKRELIERLRRQADHVASGGRLDASPLAALVVAHKVMPLPGRVRHHE